MIAYKLVMHPTQPDILMVATNEGIFRTTTGGTNWSQHIENNIWFWDIEFHPTNPSIVYAVGNDMGVETRFYTSTNSGATFTETADFNWSNSSNWNRAAIAVSPNSSNNVYVLAGPATSTGNFRGFYRSTDGGDNFTLRTSSPNILGRHSLGNDAVDQERYDLCVAINPDNVNRVVTGGIRVWTSSNPGNCKTILASALAAEALKMMDDYKINALLVVDDNNLLVGLLNMHDLLRARVV
jgi:hypothetical protein